MISIIFATHREAKPFIEGSRARPIPNCRIACYASNTQIGDACITAVCGMGKVAAAIASSHLVTSFGATTLISAGLCGLLHREKGGKVGDLLRIHSTVEGDCDRFGQDERTVACSPHWFPRLKTARLVTCDQPVFSAAMRSKMAEKGDLADMEGAAVARVADVYNIECAMVKGISDDADEKGRRDLSANIDWISCRIASALMAELKEKCNH
jgi:adenosylhomocysteine nucleosidase